MRAFAVGTIVVLIVISLVAWRIQPRPVKRYCFTQKYLCYPEYPSEDFNSVWRDPLVSSEQEEISPFVKGPVLGRIVLKQLRLYFTKMNSDNLEAVAGGCKAGGVRSGYPFPVTWLYEQPVPRVRALEVAAAG